MTETIEQKLTELPEKIKAQELTVLRTSAKLDDARRVLEAMKIEISQDILCTKEGKEKYTNENARRIAISELLDKDEDYQKRLKSNAELEQLVALERIDLEFLHNTFRANIAIAGMAQYTNIGA